MESDFFTAAVPEPITLMGLRLRPLSLGHVILLNRVESSFITGTAPSFEDLALSVLICSLSYEDGLAIFNDPDIHKFMVRWHDRLTGASLLTLAGLKKPKPLDFVGYCEKFSEYIAANSKCPKYSFDPSKCGEMECPLPQVVKVTLMRDLHIPERELMDRSWLVCLWDYVTLKALAGQVSLYSEGAIEAAKETGKRLHELIASGKIRPPQAN